MALTKTQKKLAGVLGAGAIALLADNFVFRGPQVASAESSESLLVAKPGESDNAAAGGVGAIGAAKAKAGKAWRWGAPEIAKRVSGAYERAGKPMPAGDPFHFPAAPVVVQAVPAMQKAASPSERPGMTFARTHGLKAIMSSGEKGMALVGDTLVHAGETMDGWRLMQVTPSAVVFERGGEQVRLNLSDVKTKP